MEETEFLKNGEAKNVGSVRIFMIVVIGILSTTGLYLISQRDYALYHSIVEMLAIVISVGIFFVILNYRQRLQNHFFIILAMGILASAVFDTLHLFAYKGVVGVLHPDPLNPSNLATQLWLAARFIQSASYLAATFFIQKKTRFWAVVLIYLLIVFGLLLSIFWFHNFPVAYIEGHGLTDFKKVSEYVFCAMFLASGIFVYRKRSAFDKEIYKLIIASVAVSIASEFAFVLYVDVYGIFNFIGHVLKVGAYYLLNRAIVVKCISKPQDLLYRELVLSEKALQESEAILKERGQQLERDRENDDAILRSIGAGMVAMDANGRIKFANDAFEKLAGLSMKEIVEKSMADVLPFYDEKNKLIPRDKRPLRIVMNRNIKNPIRRSNFHILQKNGRRVDLSVLATPILRNGRVIGGVVVFSDITAEKALEKTRMEYISFVAHQFRTPLSSIGLTAEFALNTIKKKRKEDVRPYFGEILKQSSNLAQIIDTFLSVTKIEAGMFNIKPQISNIPDIIEDKIRELQALLFENKINIHRQYSEKFKLTKVDPKVLDIILDNLLSNAIKYSPRGGTIDVGLKRTGEHWVLMVEDSGIGIPKEDQGRVFDRMFRSTNTKASEGSGLGLYIVRMLIEQSGGKIWFKSPVRESEFSGQVGTAFYVSYPLSGMHKKPSKIVS